MAIKKKPRTLTDELEYRLSDYRASDYVKTYADVERVKAARWKLHEKVRKIASETDSEEVKTALRFALDIIVDEIQALAFLGQAKRKLEEPHVAAWIALNDKVEQLKEDLERVTAKLPDDPSY